jgi:hypothetical protein
VKWLRRMSAAAWMFGAVAASSGCVLHPSHHGTLQLDWSVNGGRSPSVCRSYQSDSIEIALRGDVREYIARDCNVFATSLDLFEGGYFGSARLLDINGFPTTTSVDLGSVASYPRETTVVSLDFPADSFF